MEFGVGNKILLLAFGLKSNLRYLWVVSNNLKSK